MEEKILSIITLIGIIFSIIEIGVVSFKYVKGTLTKEKFLPYLVGGILILVSSIISKIIL